MPLTTLATITLHFTIYQTDVMTWVVNKSPYLEPKTLIIHGNMSDAWNAETTLKLPLNWTVDLTLRIANDLMDTVSFAVYFPATASLLVPLICATPFLANRTKQ